MPHVEGAGVALSYEERGAGRPVVVVHGLASGAAPWSPALDELAAAHTRAVAYDRRGYGCSGAPEPYVATTVQEQAEDAAALLSGLDAAPALLVGDGFGALVALDVLVRRPALATGAVLADPPLFSLVPEATEALAAERLRLEETLREGGPAAAVAAWLGDSADAEASDRARAAQRGFFADYGGLASWSVTRAQLRGIRVPVAVVTRPAGPRHVGAAADALARLLPDVRRTHDGDVIAAAKGLLA